VLKRGSQEKEGVKVENDKAIHWKTVFWDPTTELL
jgi:hypothetical protein